MPEKAELLRKYFKKLSTYYGPQEWWPGETRFEVLVGAILTQNTNWKGVEKAIRNLKVFRILDPHKLHELDEETIQEAVRPSGYFRQKAARLKAVVAWLVDRFGGSMDEAAKCETADLRRELLTIKGIGPETADSILLYALDKPVFVIDTYTYRVLTRHDLIGEETTYEEMQEFLMQRLDRDVKLYNEYHALLVAVGKQYCRKTEKCDKCPLRVYLNRQ